MGATRPEAVTPTKHDRDLDKSDSDLLQRNNGELSPNSTREIDGKVMENRSPVSDLERPLSVTSPDLENDLSKGQKPPLTPPPAFRAEVNNIDYAQERKSSSIATLRMRAKQYEMRMNMPTLPNSARSSAFPKSSPITT